jgi:hypothetical protein
MEKLLEMVSAKSKILEFSPPYLGNFSKGDAQTIGMGGNLRPEGVTQIYS